MSVAMIITSTVQPGQRDTVHQLWLEHLAPAAEANDAQQVVVWCDDDNDADTFHLFEIYADHDAMGANAQSPAFAGYMGAVMPLLAGEPTVRMASPRWTTGV